MEAERISRRAVHISGVVQGVGFRPFVYRTARELGLNGWVRNAADGVLAEVEGATGSIEEFLRRIRTRHPRGAVVEKIEVLTSDGADVIYGFEIRASAGAAQKRPAIPADLAACADCLSEVRNPGARRSGYPFTSCSHCGPRYSVIESVPYDRARTTMRRFRMCDKCRAEYEDPSDRRLHAQPIACPRCGPQLALLAPDGTAIATHGRAIAVAVDALRHAQTIALKGLGGFQLLVDAADSAAVARLRERKRRPEKPFAVMFPSLEAALACCTISVEEQRMLSSAEAPIVLLAKRRAAPIAENVAPRNPWLGAMLPYTPLHQLILDAFGGPLVCTSGNLSEEPICIRTGRALERLRDVADLFLVNDRPIARPLDDSVVRIGNRGPVILRRARGYAPLPAEIGIDGPPVLAVGGHLKNTLALAIGKQVVVSQHIGDLDSVDARQVFADAIADLIRFYDVRPQALACDLHPDYASTLKAESLARLWRVPLFRVQHHHAHIAACIAEHALGGPVLGFAWDGTGYGGDGTVWGGEALVCEGSRFKRVAHLRAFPLIGGERAIREPRRAALGVLCAMSDAERDRHARRLFSEAELGALLTAAERKINAPMTTSVGRLFDAIAALTGICRRATFEGQAAMQLEYALAPGAADEGAYPIAVREGCPLVGDWAPAVKAILEDIDRDTPAAVISARFHNSLVAFAVQVARRIGLSNVALSGGCFQNQYLASALDSALRAAGFEVFAPRRFPPNDGGLAFGQVLVARHLLREASHVPGHSG